MSVARRRKSAKAVRAKPPSTRRRVAGDGGDGAGLERLLADFVFDAVWKRDVDSETLHWDGSPESVFGYPRADVQGHVDWWRARVHRDDFERVSRAAKRAIRGKAAGFSSEYR